jgi:hypothetical protein
MHFSERFSSHNGLNLNRLQPAVLEPAARKSASDEHGYLINCEPCGEHARHHDPVALGRCLPVVTEHHRAGTLLRVRSVCRLELASEPSSSVPRAYGTTLGQALFRDATRDAFVRARSDCPDGVRVLVFVEAEDLKTWRWEWLCAPLDGDRWDLLSLDQRALFSLYLSWIKMYRVWGQSLGRGFLLRF